MRCLWSVHVRGCLRREVQNDITITDYARLSRNPCLYCGREPFNWTKFHAKNNILYNGIDRVDNSQDYTLENLVTCCKDCNGMKFNKSPDDFLEHVMRIAAHVQSFPETPSENMDPARSAG